MNFLVSLNYRMFSKCDNKYLIDTIIKLDVNKLVKGAEIYINMENEEEKEYCLNLTQIMKDKDLILQIHSADINKLEEKTIIQYLEYYNQIASIYECKIKLTIHPAIESSKEDSIIKTIKILTYVSEYIKQNNFNLEVLLENLNEHKGILRCNIYEVYTVMDKLNIDGITLDMGHYVYDYSNDYTTINKYTDKIKNIHLHDVSNHRQDHYPFYDYNVKVEEAIKYLYKIKYRENIVLEIGLGYLNGENFEDKIKEYIDQIEYVNSFCIL